MKLFLKKYAPLLGVAILSMILAIGLRLIQNISINYLEIALYINILTSTIFIRSIDDIVDYKTDLEEKKEVLPKAFTLVVLSVCTFITILNSFIIQGVLGAVLALVYIGIVVLAFKFFSFLKTFIYPINTVIYFVFLQNIYEGMFIQNVSIAYTLTVVIITLIVSIIISMIKGRK